MTSADTKARAATRLVYLGDDAPLVEAARRALRRIGADLVAMAQASDLAPREVGAPGPTVILDARAVDPSTGLEATVASLRSRLGDGSRVFYLAPHGSIQMRLDALRAGVDGLVPLAEGASASEALAARLAELVRDEAGASRVLVVDDQPVVALFAVRVLQRAGMEVRAVSDPLLVLDAVEAFRPDVILMDLHMPGASGIELTRIIRDHDRLHSLPIVFFSSEASPAVQLETLRVGGDDFIPKPVSPQRLVSVVQDRLRRAREQRSGAHGSGLLDRRAFLARLERLFGERAAMDEGCGLLLVAPDHPFTLDEAPGEGDGRAWPARLAAGLGACLEPGEVIAELAESGLAILARRSDRADLAALAERLREVASELLGAGRHGGGAASVGLAPLDAQGGDALTALSRAESALGEARRRGGGRLVVHVSALPRPGLDGRQSRLVRLIERALERDDLPLYFQPIAALRRSQGALYEVLVRLRAPDGELLPAGDFLAAAERAGMMEAIDRRVRDRALAIQQQSLGEHGGLRLLIHQRLASVADGRCIDELREQIAARDLIRHRPLLRLSAAELRVDRSLAEHCLGALARLGIGICVEPPDDEPATWRWIERLRPALVRLPSRGTARLGIGLLCERVKRLHAAGALVMVGGIEDAVAISPAWQAGVDLIQGNFVQPPGPALDFDFTCTALE